MTIFQIYDGDSLDAVGSVWVKNSSVPVYATTGPETLVVFKSGSDNVTNSHLGFVFNVTFVSGIVFFYFF